MDGNADGNAQTNEALDKWVRATDLPLLLLALISIPLLVLEGNSTNAVAAAAATANWMIWAAFALDLFVRVWLVREQRWRYLDSGTARYAHGTGSRAGSSESLCSSS